MQSVQVIYNIFIAELYLTLIDIFIFNHLLCFKGQFIHEIHDIYSVHLVVNFIFSDLQKKSLPYLYP